MDQAMIEKITEIVVSKLNDQPEEKTSSQEGVKVWDYNSEKPNVTQVSNGSRQAEEAEGKAKISTFHTPEKQIDNKETKAPKQQPDKEVWDDLKQLTNKTPARIGVGRAGPRPKTNTWLQFRYDHAAAVDAVFGKVDESLLEDLDLFTVKTKVTDKESYIRRPDYGRRLSDEAKKEIEGRCRHAPQVQIIVSDGLSSKAIDENLEDVYLSLQQSLKSLGLDVGTPFFIEKGRVAIMDDVGEMLKPEVIVLLVGERPGLVSAESMSAYLCYKPRLDTIESDRMVVSNIHRGGIPPVEAGAYLGSVIEKILDYEASGVELVKKEG
ncbi:ethanolamine ammonia-lyase subunit EutC [Thalassobacillus devorans]|uniref:ethanolamine ammonia-lyase subunit EutC n=1 Tax=Thalassobacillus devorans TaxID=279813 RepID=UPI00048E2B80|nr:ethanolamine ammonia-lyase subunit EutC [Thalassobacillus devorans]